MQLLTYNALNGLVPQYLSEPLVSYDPPHLLQSKGTGYLLVPRMVKSTAGGRASIIKPHSYGTAVQLVFGTQTESPSVLVNWDVWILSPVHFHAFTQVC